MVKHFLLPLMKRKNNSKLNEGSQIPYSLQDFKEGDRVHVIGGFDGERFDDLGTIVTTSNEIANPWSNEDSILIKFDEPQQREHDLHDGETGIREIAVKCYGNCWWIWLASIIPNYVPNPDVYDVYSKFKISNKHHIIKKETCLVERFNGRLKIKR
jgi:hypothetical protein